MILAAGCAGRRTDEPEAREPNGHVGHMQIRTERWKWHDKTVKMPEVVSLLQGKPKLQDLLIGAL